MAQKNVFQRLFSSDGSDDDTASGRPVRPSSSPSSPSTTGAAVDAEVYEDDIVVNSSAASSPRLTTSNMSQEQLKLRRTNLIEGSKFGRPAHEAVMLFILRFWLLLGPLAFVALTTSEVAYIFTRLLPPGDNGDMVILGGALFIDLAMMFTTFGVAIKRRDLAEKREANGGVVAKREEAEVIIGTLMWLVFAVINIISQGAFLLHVISMGHDPNVNLLYIFVASRVVGFILGDASTAFFLAKVDNSHLKLIARAEREKANLYSDIAKAEGDRRLQEAKSDAEVLLVQIRVEQEQQDAQFLATLKREMFKDILASRGLPAPSAELEQPNRSRLRRLDTNNS